MNQEPTGLNEDSVQSLVLRFQPMRDLEILEVEWDDPRDTLEGWVDIKEAKPKDFNPAACKSVGYLFKETEKVIILVGSQNHVNGRDHQVGAGIVIPKGIITKITKL